MKATKKELTRITGFPLVQLLPGAQTAYIIINLENILSQESLIPALLHQHTVFAKTSWASEPEITIASLGPNVPQQAFICLHPRGPTGFLLMRNLALCSFLAPNTARADGGTLGAGDGKILKFPIRLT